MLLSSGDRVDIAVSINGDPVFGLLRASIATTNCFAADTFSLTFVIGGRPTEDLGFWSAISSAYVELTAAVSSKYGVAYQPLITGTADAIHVDAIHKTVGLEGRDLSSSMIDSYRQQDFVNQTASEIVATIAQYHGLGAVVTPTTGNIGRYYSDGYTKLSLGQFSRFQSDWDLVVQLARQNEFDVFVQGQTLYFQPASGTNLMPVAISWRDVQSARMERHLGIGQNVLAKVQSWNSQNMAAYDSESAAAISTSSGALGTAAPAFLFSGSNYTSQQVSDAAERYTAELKRLSTILHLNMPWDLALSPRTTILINDTNSGFDTAYRIDDIERHFSSTQGCSQSVRAAQIIDD
jgi:hypothetical protein